MYAVCRCLVATCICTKTDLDPDRGTRHRAVGLHREDNKTLTCYELLQYSCRSTYAKTVGSSVGDNPLSENTGVNPVVSVQPLCLSVSMSCSVPICMSASPLFFFLHPLHLPPLSLPPSRPPPPLSYLQRQQMRQGCQCPTSDFSFSFPPPLSLPFSLSFPHTSVYRLT